MTRTRSGLARWMVVVLASAFAALEGCGGDEPTEAAPDGDGGSETSTPDSSMGMPDTGLGDSSSADTGIDAGDAGDAGLVFDNPKLAVGGGTVFTSLHAGRSWYLGGSFTRISPHGHINFIGINTAAGAARAAPLACPSPQSFNAAVRAIAKTATAIYVGGDFTTYKGASANRIAKLDPITCALDVTFSPVGANGFNGIVTALAVNATDLYVGGTFSGYRGVASSASNLAKLDATTGVLDTTFSPAGAAANGFDNTVNALALNATDLYVGGTFSAYKGAADSARRIAKLDRTTGVLDTTFSPPGATANGFNIEVSALVINATAVYAAGQFTEYKGVAASANRIAKLDLTTGALDTTFSPPGATTNGFDSIVHALALTGTDLYAGGGFTAYKGVASSANRIAKLNSTTGAIDTTFSPVGATANGFGSQVLALALSGNDLFVGGEFQSYRNAFGSANRFAKLNATTGVLDATFVPTGSNYGGVSGLAVRSALVTGTTLFLGGDFAVYAGTSVSKIAKLDDVTFTVDTTFSPAATNGFDNNSVVRALAASGTSIYAGGTFQAYRGVFFNANRIAKLDATTGALDTTFSPPGATANGFNQGVRALAANATDVYVGGDFSAYKGVASSARSIAKLNATTGAIDTTFSPVGATANGFDSAVYALAINATDVYAGGEFTAYRGAANSANRIAKLGLATGALDTTFSPAGATANGFNNGVRALAVNGTDVYVGGNFTAYQGVASSANRIAKLARTTGVIDATFSPAGATSNGFDGTVNSIALNATDVYVSGFVSAYKGVANSANGIAKLGLTSGAIDTVFSPVGPTANGVDDEVYTFTLGTSTCAVGCGTVLLLGGLYERYRDTPAGSLTILDPTTGAVK